MSNKKKLMTIAIAAEITPAKTIIPIIKKIKLLESKNFTSKFATIYNH